jgi:hypothetical protein
MSADLTTPLSGWMLSFFFPPMEVVEEEEAISNLSNKETCAIKMGQGLGPRDERCREQTAQQAYTVLCKILCKRGTKHTGGHHKINLVTFLSLVLQFPNHYSEYTRCKRWSWYDTNVLSWRTNQDLGEPIKTILGHVETDIHYWVIYGAMLLISIALCTPVLFVYE